MKPPRPAAIAAALIFALSCFGFTLFVWISFGGTVPLQAKAYQVHGQFASDAINLTSGSQVRISGVKVGRVVKVEQRGGGLDATMELEPKFAPLPRDARGVIRIKTLLGETFVELTPGTPGGPTVPEGGYLPKTAIAPSQTVDQVLASFDERTRSDLKTFLNELSTSLDGRGEDINAALGNFGPAMEDVANLVEILDRQKLAVRRLVRNTGVTLQAIGDRPDAAQRLVTAGDQVFAATAARNNEVTATVRALPPFLRELRGTLASLEGTAVAAGPTLRAIRPVAPLVRPGLEATDRLLPELTRVARGLKPVIDASVKGLPAATKFVRAAPPLLDTLDPTGNGLAPVLSNLLPVIDFLDLYQKEVLNGFGNIASSTQWSTKTPSGIDYHFLRFLAPIMSENLYGLQQRLPSNRHNAYAEPGWMGKLATGGLPSLDCRNLSNPATLPILGSSGTVPCVEQKPFRFRGQTLSYPHLTVDNRGAGR
jgi:virulence factor Mce-like protein